MNDFLVTYLDSIDEGLLDYLDEDEELDREVVKRMRKYVSALRAGEITPANLLEDWADWYSLIPAFVAAYCPNEVEALERRATFLSEAEQELDVELSAADRRYLQAVELQLDMYHDMRGGQ